MRQALLGEQTPDQDECAVALVLGRRADRVLHPSSKWLETPALWRFPAAGAYGPFPCPSWADFSSWKDAQAGK